MSEFDEIHTLRIGDEVRVGGEWRTVAALQAQHGVHPPRIYLTFADGTQALASALAERHIRRAAVPTTKGA